MVVHTNQYRNLESIHRLRHRWEMPLVWLSALVTLFAIIFGAFVATLSEAEVQERFGEHAAEVTEYAWLALFVLVFPIFVFFMRFYQAAVAKSNAVRVGPDQFPELWEMYARLGEQLDMPKLPKLYVTNGDGVVNAYALSCNTRYKYIVMHSEVVIGMKDNPEIVEFILAHEMAHHKLGHVSLWRIIIGFIPGYILPLGVSTTRAQEYSADRVAKSVCNHDRDAMKLLAVGPWIGDEVNLDAWAKQCNQDRREFYIRIANTLSTHPVLAKRFNALRDIDEHGFEKHGEMF